jgi:hypothetical protein
MRWVVTLAALLGGVAAPALFDTGRVAGQVAVSISGAVFAACVVLSAAAVLLEANRRVDELVANEVDQ